MTKTTNVMLSLTEETNAVVEAWQDKWGFNKNDTINMLILAMKEKSS